MKIILTIEEAEKLLNHPDSLHVEAEKSFGFDFEIQRPPSGLGDLVRMIVVAHRQGANYDKITAIKATREWWRVRGRYCSLSEAKLFVEALTDENPAPSES